MKKDKPFKIRIPSPCSQDWNAMPIDKGGRYCGQCTQVVHDFSQMPDNELLQYFKTNPATACGRFHKHQLDRAIQPQKLRWNLPAYVRKITAAFFATLSFRTATAQIDKKAETHTTQTPVKENATITNLDNVTISGVITRGNNEPVVNAKVSVDTLITVYTDMDGKFSIPLSGELIAAHNLYFSYEGLERTVRTFHPLMGSTSYDVRLMSKEDYQFSRYVAGGIGFNTTEFPSIKFSNRQRYLNKNAKAILSFLAVRLKDNSSVMIQLVAFGKTVNDIKMAKRKLKWIHDFLIDDVGIDKERIVDKIEAAGSNNTIDILQYYGE